MNLEITLLEGEQETSYPGYSRVSIPFDQEHWTWREDRGIVNIKKISFPASTGPYYGKAITGFTVRVAGEFGNGVLSRSIALGPEATTLEFPAGHFSLPITIHLEWLCKLLKIPSSSIRSPSRFGQPSTTESRQAMKTKILFKKLHPMAVMPSQGSQEAAGFDLVSTGAFLTSNNTVIVHTSLGVAFPQGHVLLIYGRSGLAFKSNIRLVNGVGVIDSDYRGEIKLVFASDTMDLIEMQTLLGPGTRVAQAVLTPIPEVEWVEVDELPDSIRGEGGLGSTGLR